MDIPKPEPLTKPSMPCHAMQSASSCGCIVAPKKYVWPVCVQAQGLSPAQKTALRGAAFVPVANGTRLVAPEHMFSRLQLDLAPFAFEVHQPVSALSMLEQRVFPVQCSM